METQCSITHTLGVQSLFVASICIGAFWYKQPSFHTHFLYYYYYYYYCGLCLSVGLVKYFLDGIQWVRVLVAHEVFLEIYGNSISYSIIWFVVSVCKVATCWKVTCCRNNCSVRQGRWSYWNIFQGVDIDRILNSSNTTSIIIYELTLLWVINVPFNTVLFQVYAISPLFLPTLQAPAELKFWNHVLDSHQLFLNCRQRQKLNLQRYQSKQQRKIRMGGRDEAKAGSRIRTSDLDKKDKILVHLVNSFCKS